ncbi:MAG TPA: hypothetical protein VGD87_17940, partial [Archangium sp.]
MKSTLIQKLFAVALLLSVAGCDCGTNTNRRFPKIEVLDEMGNALTSVDFGKVQLNFTATKKVRIRNGGAAGLIISQANFSQAKF